MVEGDDEVGIVSFDAGFRSGGGRNIFRFEVGDLVAGGAGGSQVDHGRRSDTLVVNDNFGFAGGEGGSTSGGVGGKFG